MSKQVKILIVDDEEIILQSVRKVLKADDEHEFLVDTALSAAEGLELISPGKYDIVITDLMMPGIDGLEFIDGIRSVDRETRIIMITGYATMRTALQALRKGAFDYIAKPFTREELRGVVKNAAFTERVPAAVEKHVEAERKDEYRSFFNQTYARIRPDGTMFFGVETNFLATIGTPLSIELCAVGESVAQGFPFGAITDAKMMVFNLRAPFSGRVLNVNQEAVDSMDLICEDPRGRGWLIQVEAADYESEIENLA
jgi:CheY-like chemotaxis protein